VLEIRNLVAGYGETVVVRDVTMQVPDGGAVALLGPNGAGKTTLLRAATGLIAPMSGSVMLNGETVTGRKPYYLAQRGICHLPEGRGIFPSLSVRENIVLQAQRGQERAAIDQVVSIFPALASRMKQDAKDLSGGEQQMLALGRAFVTSPKLIVVDEVSLGLAPIIVDQIYHQLEQFAAAGVAMLVVEQYADRVLALAESICLLQHGRIVLTKPAKDVDKEELALSYLGDSGDGQASNVVDGQRVRGDGD
jgi:branched-chain amino acid transport system ATP-binding protein